MNKAFFYDAGDPVSLPLSRFRSIFSFRTGIYSPLDRAVLEGREIVLCHKNAEYVSLIAQCEKEMRPGSVVKAESVDGDAATSPPPNAERLSGPDLLVFLDNIGKGIRADLRLFLEHNSVSHSAGQGVLAAGSADDLYVHTDAKILPGVAIFTDEGPVVIDRGAKITPWSVLSGPLYVGADAMLDGVKIGGSIVGRGCRLGGEIEKSILGDFTNKHHEGFLGHSLVGSWVNFGALSTTSDLKNNYGKIKLRIAGQEVDTGRIKFGSVVGDCVKTAIGTMLNTGTVVDAGSNVFGGRPGAHLPFLSWGLEDQTYDLDRFLADCQTIFKRRGQTVPAAMRGLAALAVSLDRGRPPG